MEEPGKYVLKATAIKMIMKKIIWLVLFAWIAIHLLFVFNERYTISTNSKLIFDNLTENQYNMLFYNKPDYLTTFYLHHTTIKYLGIFPEWTISIIFLGYFVILGCGCYLTMEEEKKSERKLSNNDVTQIAKNIQTSLKLKRISNNKANQD